MLKKELTFEYTIWFYNKKQYKNIRTLFDQMFIMIRIFKTSKGFFYKNIFKIML